MLTYEDIDLMSSICTDWMETIDREYVSNLTGLEWGELSRRLTTIDLDVKKLSGAVDQLPGSTVKLEMTERADERLKAYVSMLQLLKTILPATNNIQAPLCVLAEAVISVAMEINEVNRYKHE